MIARTFYVAAVRRLIRATAATIVSSARVHEARRAVAWADLRAVAGPGIRWGQVERVVNAAADRLVAREIRRAVQRAHVVIAARRAFNRAARTLLAFRRAVAADALAECTQHSWLADRAALEALREDWTAEPGEVPWQHSYEPTQIAS